MSAQQQNAVKETEGEMTWDVPGAGKSCKTWYKIYGDLKSGKRPLIALHGGPGITSDYLTSLADLTSEFSIPVILYDQLGNGLSTHLPEKKGDTVFWTELLFLDELKRLLVHLGIYDDYDLLGQSWGGMVGAMHAARQPGGLKHLVLASSAPSTKHFVDAQERLRKTLPQVVQDVLDQCERDGKTDSKEYLDAVGFYYSNFLCRLNPMPEGLQKCFEWLQKDPTVYGAMSGPPGAFVVTGSLKDWTMIDDLPNIKVPTLLTNGWKDEVPDDCIYPIFNEIPCVRWVQFAESSHTAHLEEREKFNQIVGLFVSE